MLKKLRQLSTYTEWKNPWWELRRDEYERPDGSTGNFHYIHTRGSVMIVPVLHDGRILMLSQYRYLNQRVSLEFPGGGIGELTYETAARQELEEEAGIVGAELLLIGEFNPMNGATDEICRVFVARSGKRKKARPEITEQFEEMRTTPNEIDTLIQSGEIWDGMSIAAWVLAKRVLER